MATKNRSTLLADYLDRKNQTSTSEATDTSKTKKKASLLSDYLSKKNDGTTLSESRSADPREVLRASGGTDLSAKLTNPSIRKTDKSFAEQFLESERAEGDRRAARQAKVDKALSENRVVSEVETPKEKKTFLEKVGDNLGYIGDRIQLAEDTWSENAQTFVEGEVESWLNSAKNLPNELKNLLTNPSELSKSYEKQQSGEAAAEKNNARYSAYERAAERNTSAKRMQEIEEKYPEQTSNPTVKAIGDLAASVTNMIPSMAVSAIPGVGQLAGAGVMMATSAPDAYVQAKNEGATQEQAIRYSNLEAINQGLGDLLIGGVVGTGKGVISSVADTVTNGASTRLAKKVLGKLATSPVGKTAVKYFGNALGEGVEESLQSLASTMNSRLTYDPGAKVNWDEVAYEGLLGGLMGGVFGAAQIPANYKAYKSDADLVKTFARSAARVSSTEDADSLRKVGDFVVKQMDETIENAGDDSELKERAEFIGESFKSVLNTIEDHGSEIAEVNNDIAAAVEAIGDSPADDTTESIARLVDIVAESSEPNADPINSTVDVIREQIQEQREAAQEAATAEEKREAQINEAVLCEIDSKLRGNRKEISEARAELPENNADTGAEETAAVDEFDSAKTAPFARANISDSLGIDLTGDVEQDAESLLDSRRGVRGAIDQLTKTANEIRSSGSESAEPDIAYIRELDRAVREKNRAYTQKKANAYAAVLKQWGIKNVVVDDNLAYNYSGDDVRANGYYDRSSGEIHLSPYLSEDAAVGSIVVHEFTHRGAAADSSLVDSLLEAKNKMEAAGVYKGPDKSAYLNAYGDLINGLNNTDSEAYINEEIAAHFMQDIMENENVLEALAREDRTLLQRILDFIADLIAPSDKENRAARRAADKIRAVLEKSETAKSAGVEVAPRAKTNSNIEIDGLAEKRRFSLDMDVEKVGDLVAVHNLSEENLRKTIENGGFPMPSIAIVRASDGHAGFGDVSVVFGRETIDPYADDENRVYSSDAWTPTRPRISYKANPKAQKKIRDLYYELAEKLGYDTVRPLYDLATDLESVLNRHGGEKGTADYLKEGHNLMQAYLEIVGKGKIEPVVSEKTESMSEADVMKAEFMIEALGEDVVRAYKAPEGTNALRYRPQYMKENGDKIKEAYRRMLEELYGFNADEIENVMNSRNNGDFGKEVRTAYQYLTTGGKKTVTETDYAATNRKIEKAAKEAGFDEWVDGLLEGSVEKTGIRNNKDAYTSSGNRRSFESLHYENTLENIVKAMKESGEKGIGTLGGNIIGASAEEYGSVGDIRKAANARLRKVSQEEYGKLREEYMSRFAEIASRFAKKPDDFTSTDSAAELLTEAVAKYGTGAGIRNYLRREGKGWTNYSDAVADDLIELVNDIRSMPAAYFEAKPRRVVGIDEISAFIVPDDIKAETREMIGSTSAQVVEYEHGNEQARLEALNKLQNVRFSRVMDSANSEEFQRKYEADVDKVLSGTYNSSDLLIIGRTPAVLEKIGLAQLPVTITPNHVYSIAKTADEAKADGRYNKNVNYHGLGETAVKDIMAKISDPLMVVAAPDFNTTHSGSRNSAHRLIALLSLTSNGKQTIAPIEIDAAVLSGGTWLDTNHVASYYEKDNLSKLISEVIALENTGKTAIYFGNKKRIGDFVKNLGFQLPAIFKDISDSEFIIRNVGENVNRKIENVTQSQQFKRWFGDWQNDPEKASKVVNEDGTPKVVYHETNADFSVFDLSQSGKNYGETSEGFFFFTNKKNAYQDSALDYARESAKKGGNAQVYEVYLDIKKPLRLDSKGYYTPTAYFDENHEAVYDEYLSGDYDGVIIENSDKSNDDSVIYLVDNSTQIKSATDNIGTFDAGKPDIRYSRVMETEEQRELRRKQERIEYLEKQFRSHTALGWAKTVSPASRRAFASEIAANIPGVTVEEVSAALKKVYDILEAPKRGSKDTAEVRWKEAHEAASEAAQQLVESASANEINPLYEQYNDLRNRLRTVPVKMTISRNEFGGDEDYRRWRRGNVGLLRISNSADAIPVDTFYQGLSAQYPEFFPPEVENEADQLKRLGDAAVELRRIAGSQTEKVNPLEDIAESFAADLTNQILFGFDQLAKTTEGARREYGRMMNESDVRQAYAEGASEAAYREQTAYETGVKEGRTYNEKEVQAAAEREEIQRQIFERDFRAAQTNFSNEIERQNNRIASLENRISRKSESNRLTMARKSTLATLNRLNTMLTKPNRSKHIPQNLRAPVARLLETLGTTRLPNGKTVNAETMRDIQEAEYARFEAECARAVDDMKTSINANRVSENNSLSDQFIDKLTDNIERLKEIYAEINPASPDDAVLPPDLMTSRRTDYVRQIGRILGMVEHYVKDANVVFLNDKAVSAREFSEKMITELRQKKSRVQKTGSASRLRKAMSDMRYEFVSADLFFEMMGDSGVELMHEYRRGQTLQAQHEDEFTQYMLKVTGGKYSTHNAGFSGDLISLSIDGKGLKVTKGQLMQLYLTWKRPAGRRHLMTGGAVFTNEIGQESEANTVRITQDIYDDLVAHLSKEDIAVCDAIGKFLSKRCAEWGNEASMKMYGYRMFEDPNYFPLDVSDNALQQNWDSIDEFYRLENAGMTKSLKSDASAPLRMTDVFDVADFHVRTMAAYGAFAPISNDVQRIMNMPGVTEAVNYGMGEKGAAYLNKLVKTIASNKVRTGDISDVAAPLRFFMNAYKRQAVSCNISTALKQPLSIVRALNEIEGKYIKKAPLVMSNTEYKRIYDTMVENSGVAKMKMLGYSDTGFGKSMRQIYDTDYVNESGIIRGTLGKSKEGRTAVKAYDKITDAGMWMAGKADEMTWVRIWKACELEVADKYKGLNAEEKTRKTAERFNDIIGRTQVVDTVLDTSPLIRNDAMAILTPFMNEPTKAIATMIAAADAARDGKPYGKKKLAKAVGLVVLNNLVLEPIISTLMTMWRDEEDDTENIADFTKKFLKVYAGVNIDDGFSFTEFATSNVVGGIFSFPIIQIFYDTFADSAQNYSNEKIDTAAVSNLIKNTIRLITGLPKAKEDRAKSNYKLFSDFLGSAAAAIGIPLPTLRKQAAALYRGVLNAADMYELQWEYNKVLYNLENGSARSQKGFYDIMAAAYKAGDVEAYRKMRTELSEIVSDTPSVISPKSITKAIEERGGEVVVGSDLWYVDLQARFCLEKFVPKMQAETLITKVYRDAESKGIDTSSLLLSMPSAYEYENEDGETQKMNSTEYEDYIHDVGLLSYQVLVEMNSTSRKSSWNSLTTEQQIYAVEKAYAYAKAKCKKDFDSSYNIRSQGVWMDELYSQSAGQSKIASTIIANAKEK